MSEWSEGYVTDIEYSSGFVAAQAPAHLDLCCLLNGLEPPALTGGAQYCDLGCGQGATVSVLAAANPDIEFWGIDFNPAHVARGRALQARTGLGNMHFAEHAFADLTGPGAPDLPQFDYVAMHGVYTWVSEENRQAIRRFLRRCLKPGGVLYIAYNALPGWAYEVPLQRLLWEYWQNSRQRSDRAVEGAIDFVRRMRDGGAHWLRSSALVERFGKLVASGGLSYIVHEHFNWHWAPIYHADLARDLAEAKLDYAGSAALAENFAQLCLKPEQLRLCEELGAPALLESLKDYFMVRGFRRDVFIRGVRRLPERERDDRLRRLCLASVAPRKEQARKFEVETGAVEFPEQIYGAIFAALEEEPRTVADLLALAPPGGLSSVELAGMLVGTRKALPLRQAGGGTAPVATLAFNRAAIADAVLGGKSLACLAAARAGSGVALSLFELFAVEQLMAGLPPDPDRLAAGAWQELSRRDVTLRQEGEPIVGAEANLAILRREIGAVLDDGLPIWRRLGIL